MRWTRDYDGLCLEVDAAEVYSWAKKIISRRAESDRRWNIGEPFSLKILIGDKYVAGVYERVKKDGEE